MATATQPYHGLDIDSVPSAEGMRFVVVVSKWNKEITEALLLGAREVLQAKQAQEILVHWVPGSFELGLAAQMAILKHKPHAVICLGSIIQGETKHFDFVAQATADSIREVGIKHNLPVVFGVLTDNTWQQAKDRSGGKYGNKGMESAITAIDMACLQQELG
jgi:6,7-dimethyl-8-ribityllumazine synthase